MKISIVTPVYNDVRVGRALDSILSQQHDADLELIVIDGGSTDGTMDVLERYRSRLAVLVSEPDKGIYDGMNKGIALATGDIVGILNADDQYHDLDVLKDIHLAFQRPDVTAIYGDGVYVRTNGSLARYWKSGPYHAYKFYFGWMPLHPTFYVRRKVYQEFGMFNVNYPIAADYEFMLRLAIKHRITFQYLPRMIVRMEVGGESNGSLRNVVRANVEVFNSWRDNHLRFGYVVPILKPFWHSLQYLQKPPKTIPGNHE